MRVLADNRSMASHELSIVIPVVNDTEPLRQLLTTIRADPRVDIVVVNGGAPEDRLNAICHRPDLQLLTSALGRGRQKNVGASAAAGRWIVFLHADTRLPPQWSDGIRRAGKLYHSAQPVLTSAQRWERDGWWRRSAKNVMLQALFFAGVAPERLANWYSHPPRRSTREALVIMARVPSDRRGKSRLTRDLG